MNFRTSILMIKGFFRRYKKVANTCFTIFLVMLFVTATAVFRDNMYNMQNAINKEKFGAWYIMEDTFLEPSNILLQEDNLGKPVKASKSVEMYDATGTYTFGQLGYMSEDFIALGNLKLKEGKWPSNSNEIVMEYSALKEGGYDTKIGNQITIGYCENYSKDNEDMIYITFTLCGITDDYTSLWVKGSKMPRGIINEEAYNAIEYSGKSNLYAYGIKEQLKPDDSKAYFESLKEKYKDITYNSSVYDYKLWGSEFVYNYMYIAVMCIGIAVLVYKVTDYRNTRKDFNDKMKKIGASRVQLKVIQNFEYAFMIVLFGIVGIFTAILIGDFIASKAENYLNVSFYAVSKSVYIRSAIGIVVGLLSGYLVELVIFIKGILPKKKNKVRVYVSEDNKKMEKRRINEKHTVLKAQSRFSKTEGIIPRLGVRIFGLCVTLIIIGSFININSAYKALLENASGYDMAGAIKGDYDNSYEIGFFSKYTIEELDEKPAGDFFKTLYASRIDTMSYEEYLAAGKPETFYAQYWYCDEYLFLGSNTISEGISTDIKERIDNTPGIRKTKWWIWETSRNLSWDGLDLVKMGRNDWYKNGMKAGKNSKYLFGTRYDTPEKSFYERFEKYIPAEYRDYEAYSAGNQVIVLIEKNPITKMYDDTIKPGKTLHYMKLYNGTLKKDTYEEGIFRTTMEPVFEPQVAAVIYVDDAIREEFADILEEPCHYTVIASLNMAETLMIKENELADKWYSKKERITELNYTHFQATFDDSAVMLATENVLKSYCSVNNILTESFYAKKNMLQTQLITALMQNGATILLTIAVNLIVALMLVQNRFINRKKQFEVFNKIGMSKSQICRMCVIEAFKENLWSPLTAIPVTLIQYISYRIKLISVK